MDLDFLSTLATRSGPFATVYLDTSHDTPDAPHRIELTWRDARSRLTEQGAPEDTLTALDKAIARSEPAVGGAGQVLVATAGEVLLTCDLPTPPRREIARYSPLPHLMPMLAQHPPALSYILVVADRTGADLRAYGPTGAELDLGTEQTVQGGGGYPIHKFQGGGWSHLRYQHRVEITWEHNAAAVASHVDRLVRQLGAELLIVAGDVRAQTLLADALATHSREILVQADAGSRAAGSGRSPLDEEVERIVSDRISERRSELTLRLGEGMTSSGLATEGLESVFSALREAMVDTLLIVDDPRSDAMAVVGPEPLQLALDPAPLRDLGVEPLAEDRVDAAVVRALAATGGHLEVFEPDSDLTLRDGVGALLRRPGAGQTG